MNKVTKLQDGIWKILAKQIFTTFAEPDRGFIHIFTPERGCITPEKLGHLQKAMRFLFTNKQKKKKSSIYIRKWYNCKAPYTHSLSQLK